MTEPGTGSDLQAVRSTARLEGDSYIVNGSKTFISNGHHCGLLIVVCKTNPAEAARGVSLLVVEQPGERLIIGVGALDAETASMAKWWCTQKQCEIVDECLQFFGGYGYMLEYPIARLYADARVQKIYGGTNEIMKELIARGQD